MAPIAVTVCLVTCLLEFAQMWQPPLLQMVRSTVMGRALLGTTFMWRDLPIYPVGCVLGWLLMRRLAAGTRGVQDAVGPDAGPSLG